MINSTAKNSTEKRDLLFKAPGKAGKVSYHIIEQIRDSILSGRMKPGDRLASEKELIDGFGVSKASVREALRVLEVMGLVEIKKGISGGVFIAEVDMKTTVNSILNFLHFTSVSIKDITMLRYLLEPAAARLAASRVTDNDLSKLRLMVGEDINESKTGQAMEINFHRYLARLSENPILILIMDFIDNMLEDIKFQLGLKKDFYEKVRRMHRDVVESLANRDGEGAARAITHDLLEVGNHLADVSGSERFDPDVIMADEARAARRLEIQAAPEMDTQNQPEWADMVEVQNKCLVFKRVDTGELYIFVGNENRQGDDK